MSLYYKSQSQQHKKVLLDTLVGLEEKGYRTIDLNDKIPDGLAIKNNKIYAIEILIVSSIPRSGWGDLDIVRKKRNTYSMFDDIIFKVVKRNKRVRLENYEPDVYLTGEEKAEAIVEEFIRELQKDKLLIQ